MVFKLDVLDDDNLHEHIFSRYVELERNADTLKQDLGIQSRTDTTIEIDIEPPIPLPDIASLSLIDKDKKSQNKKLRKSKKRDKNRKDEERYNIIIEQSISDLNSTVSNNNSTTGYVLWSSTPFFLRWLLYDKNALPFRQQTTDDSLIIPPMYSQYTTNRVGIIELGTGVSSLMAIILSNHVDQYICTDQKGILNKLKYNIRENLNQVTKRMCQSETLGIIKSEASNEIDEDDINPRRPIVTIEVEELDWETFKIGQNTEYLTTIQENCNTIYILAMDVIYNEYLIRPFLETITKLREYFSDDDIEVKCLIGIHLRSQDIVTQFLESAITDFHLPVTYINDPILEQSRYSLYLI